MDETRFINDDEKRMINYYKAAKQGYDNLVPEEAEVIDLRRLLNNPNPVKAA